MHKCICTQTNPHTYIHTHRHTHVCSYTCATAYRMGYGLLRSWLLRHAKVCLEFGCPLDATIDCKCVSMFMR